MPKQMNEIQRLHSIIRKHLQPYETEPPMEIGPCFSHVVCPLCDESTLEKRPEIKIGDRIEHKKDCYWTQNSLYIRVQYRADTIRDHEERKRAKKVAPEQSIEETFGWLGRAPRDAARKAMGSVLPRGNLTALDKALAQAEVDDDLNGTAPTSFYDDEEFY